jgi:hypothetical protein
VIISVWNGRLSMLKIILKAVCYMFAQKDFRDRLNLLRLSMINVIPIFVMCPTVYIDQIQM